MADILERVAERVFGKEPASFVDLVAAAGLDPGRDFVGASLAGLDFRGEDLRGFDFANADLRKADFRDANMDGVSIAGADSRRDSRPHLLARGFRAMHPSIAISTDIPRIAGLLGSARRTTTEFDLSRPVDSQNDETLGLAGPKLAALP